MVKKVLSICLIFIMVISLNAFALTTTAITNSLNSSSAVLGVGAGIVTIGTMETKTGGTYVTLKAVLHGQMSDISAIAAGYKYDTTKVELVYDNESIASGNTNDVMKLLLSTIDNDSLNPFAIDNVKWIRINKMNTTSGGYVQFGFNDKTGSNRYSLGATKTADFAQAKFRIKDTASKLAADIQTYFSYAAHSKGYTQINATGGFEIRPVETGVTSGTIRTMEPFTFDWQLAAPDNKIAATIGDNGRVEINGVKILNGGEKNLGAVSTAKIGVFPAMGYQVATATLKGASILSDANGFVYDASGISGTEVLDVTFALQADTTKPQINHKVFKEVGLTKNKNGDFNKEVYTFAKKPTGDVIKYGIKLTQGANEVTIPGAVGDRGPLFASKTLTSATGQYGVKFIGLAPGTYTATPYAELVGGTYVWGSPVDFIAE